MAFRQAIYHFPVDPPETVNLSFANMLGIKHGLHKQLMEIAIDQQRIEEAAAEAHRRV